MRQFIFFIILLSYSMMNGQIYDFDWGIKMESTLGMEIEAHSIDKEENIYAIGRFSDSLLISDSLYLNDDTGYSRLVIFKFTSEGSICWARTYEGSIIGKSIEIDNENNILITGSFNGDFMNGMDVSSIGGWDFFIGKLDTEGNFLWVSHGGSEATFNTEDIGYDISIDLDNNIVIIGTCDQNSIFQTDTLFEQQEISTHNVFLVKYSETGEELWVREIHLNQAFVSTWNYSVEVSNENNIFISGTINIRYFDSENNSEIHDRQSLVQKYSSFGELEWENRYGDFGSGSTNSDLAIDENENIYLSGTFANYLIFDTDTIYALNLGQVDGYILKLNSNGDYLWDKQIKKRNFTSTISINPFSEELYFSGEFFDWVLIDQDTVFGEPNDQLNLYLGSFNLETSALNWIKHSSGNGNIRPKNLEVSSQENIYLIGRFKNLIVLGDIELEANLINTSWPGEFLIKLKKEISNETDLVDKRPENILVYPNPTSGIVNLKMEDNVFPLSICIYNYSGQLIFCEDFLGTSNSHLIDVSNFPNNIYFIQIRSEKYFHQSMILKAR